MSTKTAKQISSPDSIVVAVKSIVTEMKDTSLTPTLFQNHLLATKNNQSQLHLTNFDYSISAVLLLLYVLFVWLYVTNRKKLNQIIKGFYINRFAGQFSRDEFSIGNRVSVFLSIFFVLTITIFINRTMQYFGFRLFTTHVALSGIITTLFIIVAYSIKFSSIRFFGYIFQLQREANEYSITVFLFCNTLGLFMLPLVICLTFVKQIPTGFFIYTGMAIIGVFVGIRMMRGLILGLSSSQISKIYLFMYLCTLEILPIIILVKFFMIINQ